jgi:hypothetical protein
VNADSFLGGFLDAMLDKLEDVIESELHPPRHINRLTEKGVNIALRLDEFNEKLYNKVKLAWANHF